MIDLRKIANKIISYILPSYGANGKSAIIQNFGSTPDCPNISRTNDGKQILYSICRGARNNPLAIAVAEEANIVEQYCGDGTTVCALAFLRGVQEYTPVKEEEFKQVFEVVDEFVKNNSISIFSAASISDFISTSVGKSIGEEGRRIIQNAIEETNGSNGRKRGRIRVSDRKFIYDDNKEFDLFDVKEGLYIDCTVPGYLQEFARDSHDSDWIVIIADSPITANILEIANNQVRAMKQAGQSEFTKALVLGTVIDSSAHDFYGDLQRIKPVIMATIKSRNFLEEVDYMRAIMKVVGIKTSMSQFEGLSRFIHQWIGLTLSLIDIEPVKDKYLADLAGLEALSTVKLPGHKEILAAAEAPINAVAEFMLCAQCDKEKAEFCNRHAESMIDITNRINRAISAICFNHVRVSNVAVSVEKLSFGNNFVILSGFPRADKREVDEMISDIKNKIEKASDDDERIKYMRILSLIDRRGIQEFRLNKNLLTERRKELLDGLSDVVLAYDCLLDKQETDGFVKGNHEAIKALSAELSSKKESTCRIVSNILDFIASHPVAPLKAGNEIVPLDSSLTLRNVVNSALRGVRYSTTFSGITISESENVLED